MIATVLFDKYKIPWIAEQTGYSESYLRRIQSGHSPINRWFMRRICDALGEEKDSLFFDGVSADGDSFSNEDGGSQQEATP